MITERDKVDAFCIRELVWQHADGTDTPITEVYWGPDEYGSTGPHFACSHGWELYDIGDQLTLLVRTWKTRSSEPDRDPFRDDEGLAAFRSLDRGRGWKALTSVTLGHGVKSR